MITNNYYTIYIDDTITLASTIVIKSAESADSLNKYITDYYGPNAVDKLDMTSWKYYLNISGQYHSTDTIMNIVSLDTLETIVFSISNLIIHRATARAYVYGSRQYIELVTLYPNQEMLILGILYPVDITTAINAPNNTILGYPDSLIEVNEYSLVPKLQNWINGYNTRWVNQQFAISDDLYNATSLGIMYLNLVPAILTFRLEACKTNEAHSFHVRQYLASHGLLDAYVSNMTTKQTLFFYRNIAYIERNAGKQEIFTWLVEHIMTERFIPIAEYTMRHNLLNQPTDLYPILEFRKKPINLGYSADLADTITLPVLLTKENVSARDNSKYMLDNVPILKEVMENSLSNVVLTKVLESSLIDRNGSSPYTLEDILLNHWIFLSSNGLYSTYLGVTNPKTGERIPLTVKEAYIFVWYAFCNSNGIILDKIPNVLARRVQRIPTPSVDDLMSIVDSNLIDKSIATMALSMQPILNTVISTEAFYSLCTEIFNAAQMQRSLAAYQEHHIKNGMVQGMINRIYSDNVCVLEPADESYATWFSDRNIVVTNLTKSDFGLMYLSLVKDATGLSLNNTKSVKDLQTAMVKMLTQLSSYSVQIIGQINNSGITQTDWPTIKVGDVDNTNKALRYISDILSETLDSTSSISDSATIPILINDIRLPTDNRQFDKVHLEVIPFIRSASISDVRLFHIDIINVTVKETIPLIENKLGIVPVIGINEYLLLPLSNRLDIKDIYSLQT